MSENKCKNCGASCDICTEYCCDACARGENKHTVTPWTKQDQEDALFEINDRLNSCGTAWEKKSHLRSLALFESLDGVEALFYVEDEAGEFVEHVSSSW